MKRNDPIVKALEFYGTRCSHRGQWKIHEWLRNRFEVSLNEDIQVRRAGLQWKLNPHDYVQQDLFWLNSKDPWESFHIRRLLGANSTVLDVGANFGYYALMIANIPNRNCRVHAFEPIPSNFERLETNIRLNNMGSRVLANRLALSDRVGNVSMTLSLENTGSAHVSEDSGDIPLATIDQYCESKKLERLDFIKIDAEGYEPFILRGATNSIREFSPTILLELNPPTLRRFGYAPQDVVDLVQEHGYKLFSPKRKELIRLNQLPTGSDYVNVFCIRP